jgi:uncharacterized protein
MDKEINELVGKVSKSRKILAAYLFGSAVRGELRGISDIDICVIGRLNKEEKRRILRECSEKLDISFFDELPISIKFRVFKEGRVLFVRNHASLNRIKMITLREYRDYYEIVKKRIAERFRNVR